jgi:hypothetical protein
MTPREKTIHSQPSWVIANDCVELAITKQGGQMAPVTFARKSKKPIQPYYISPWQGEGKTIDEPVIAPLRGDFFCLPFGGNDQPHRGVSYRVHGAPAGGTWRLASLQAEGDLTTLNLAMKLKNPGGKITKSLTLIAGQNVIYSRHTIEGISGKFPLGHHATLAADQGQLLISTSRFALGMTAPGLLSDPAEGAYASLADGKRFTNLAKVPTLFKDPAHTDCTRFPARPGFVDILGLYKKSTPTPAWTTAVNAKLRYLWFSLKNPALLPATLFWMSDGGRHMAPWNGRNCCIGLEDVCGYFADGAKPSAAKNEINQAGFPTAVKLSKTKPTVVPYIQGCIPTPAGFDRIASVEFDPGRVTFHSESGKAISAVVHHEFLAGGTFQEAV